MTDKKPLLYVKRYATGKFTVHIDGGTECDSKLVDVLSSSTFVSASIDADRFRKRAADLGVPTDVIDSTLASVRIFDDTYDVDESRRY